MNPLSSAIPIHHPATAARTFSGETVVVDSARNVVRMFNPVGSRIWELADGTRTAEQIAVTLSKEFNVELDHAQQSVALFLGELVEKNLLTWA